MTRLFLFRHAQAEGALPSGHDIDRRLTPQGRDDAVQIGRYLARHRLVPDLAVVSSAARTQETWSAAAAVLPAPPPVITQARLFNASCADILSVLQALPADAKRPVVVAHNPGLQEAALLLTASGDAELRERLREGLPTAGLVVLDFMIEDWHALRPQSGRLERFLNPRLLTAATE